jgi:hypothetical protein
MKKVVRLSESEFIKLIERIVKEQQTDFVDSCSSIIDGWNKKNTSKQIKLPASCRAADKQADCMKQLTPMIASYGNTIKTYIQCRTKNMAKNLMEDMMDVSSDSEYYQKRKREVTIPFDELSMLGQFATEFCRGKEGLPDCKKVREIYRNYNLFM